MAAELSAPAMALLLDPGSDRGELVKTALRELVLRGHWHLGEGGRRLVPGTPPPAAGLPAPLGEVDRALRGAVRVEGIDLRAGVRDALRLSPQFPHAAARDTELALRSAGLLERRRVRVLLVVPRRKLMRTEAGEAFAEEVRARLAEPGPLTALGTHAALLDSDEARRRRASAEGGGVRDTAVFGGALFPVGADAALDEGAFDAIGDLGGGSFDSAFDGGFSDGGGSFGGGDGGGGGGGDGGGGSS